MTPGDRNDASDAPREGDWRYRALLEVMDLVALHSDLDGLLPDLGVCLRKIVEFDGIGLVLPRPGTDAADRYTVMLASPEAPPSATHVDVVTLPSLAGTDLATLLARHDVVVLHDLDDHCGYPELVAGLRAHGKRSACLIPLTTALRPVGIIGFASAQIGAYDHADLAFLGRVAGHVAVAIDNVRHHQQATAYQHTLEADRDHWRTLLEINNAVVTTLDLTSLLNAVAPNLRRMIAHDFTGLVLLDRDGKRLGLHAVEPRLPAELDQAIASIDPAGTPFAAALAARTAIEVDAAQKEWLPDALRTHPEAQNTKRMCFVPLVTPRRTLGGMTLARRSPEPFSRDELARASQAAAQIAIAIENALAFGEIASLKDRLTQENVYLESEIRGSQHFEEIIGESQTLQRVLAQARSVATTDTAVLLLGETGTGKELVARAIHSMSERHARPLVTVNCATSPAGLLESEWFGHEKGAFTGALAPKTGRFELAHQGTLFLDEIGDVPLDLQAKLLRVLQEHEIERLGSTRTLHVDFRLIAATNRSLEEMVSNREYRADLYYRLNVFPIRIPPLRDRREDIPPLVRYFVQRFARRLRRAIDAVPREAMDALCRWHWPGNVRELQNVIERAVILTEGTTLRLRLADFETAPAAGSTAVTLADAERRHILDTLDRTGWVIGGPRGAAIRLGLKRTTLTSTMRRLSIERPKPGARR